MNVQLIFPILLTAGVMISLAIEKPAKEKVSTTTFRDTECEIIERVSGEDIIKTDQLPMQVTAVRFNEEGEMESACLTEGKTVEDYLQRAPIPTPYTDR